MVVDYSKWDKLELSDDSDIEVHPNVDKKSFIRWKQRDIHEKREQAKFRMLQLEVNIETNEDLLKRVGKLIKAGEEGRKVGINVEDDVKFAEANENKEKPIKATSPEQPKYSDMIESMLMQIVNEDGNPKVVLNKLKEHQEMIENALKDEQKELAKLTEERKQHITSEDLKTGWDSTIVYSGSNSKAASNSAQESTTPGSTSSSSSGTKTSTTTIETINSPREIPTPKINEDGLEELLPDTARFGEIPKGDMKAAYQYMMDHPYIITENQKDALTMSAFEHELAGDHKRTEQVVWNALLLQYCAALGKNGAPIFFSKITQPDHVARKAFEQDFETTFKHIQNRCKVLKGEYEKQADNDNLEETIQLQAVEPDTELIIGIPEEGTEGYAIYNELSPAVKEAIGTKKLEKINEELAKLNIEDAEELVGKLSESGVLKVENKIYDAKEWDEKKKEIETANINDLNDEVD